MKSFNNEIVPSVNYTCAGYMFSRVTVLIQQLLVCISKPILN